MAIIPGLWCEDCLDEGRETPAEHVCDLPRGVIYLCDGCAGQRYDAQQESDFAAYHGGSGPFSLNEQCAAALKQKRELER